ncbi:SWIM zinc finger family protein [Streptomyces chrestomyceticus]|uniref:SWIM zinc finger family protein n=1 Tax=Streptomyces chrestomyceticus TaxID=68185 RepID=UPI0019D11E55|nr:SWIM zinc finger family protein [Streptomyces chrestomyceticus]
MSRRPRPFSGDGADRFPSPGEDVSPAVRSGRGVGPGHAAGPLSQTRHLPEHLDRSDRSRTFPPLPQRSGARGLFAETWWGSAWLDALETTALDSGRLARGRTYARDGNVDTINITPGRIAASVRGSRPRPYNVVIRLRQFAADEWAVLLDTVAAEPAQLTALLAKKLPKVVAEAGVRLLPGPGDLVPRCSCPDHGNPCKHAAAVCFQVARLLDADPFVLLLMRGRGERELLDELSRRNATLTARESRSAQLASPGTAAGPLSDARSGPRADARAAAAAGRAARAATAPGDSGAREGSEASEGAEAEYAEAEYAEAEYAETEYAPDPAPSEPVRQVRAPRGVLARAALADRRLPPLPSPMPLPPQPGQAPALPDADGLPLDAGALEFLATDATARAHAYLSHIRATAPEPRGSSLEPQATVLKPQAGGSRAPLTQSTGPGLPSVYPAGSDHPQASVRSPFPALTTWQDGIRLAAAAHPTAGLTSTTRALYRDLAAATGRTVTDVARAVAAWRQGGLEGLDLLDTTWNPPAGDFDRARSALTAAGLPALRPRYNHLTDPARGIQLRFGHDNRWYPYESDPGTEDWWPTGRADADPAGALTALLGR